LTAVTLENAAVVHVTSTEGFATSGSAFIDGSDTFNYTSTTETTFEDCTGVLAHDFGCGVSEHVVDSTTDNQGAFDTHLPYQESDVVAMKAGSNCGGKVPVRQRRMTFCGILGDWPTLLGRLGSDQDEIGRPFVVSQDVPV
jgi:hypothetical protein